MSENIHKISSVMSTSSLIASMDRRRNAQIVAYVDISLNLITFALIMISIIFVSIFATSLKLDLDKETHNNNSELHSPLKKEAEPDETVSIATFFILCGVILVLGVAIPLISAFGLLRATRISDLSISSRLNWVKFWIACTGLSMISSMCALGMGHLGYSVFISVFVQAVFMYNVWKYMTELRKLQEQQEVQRANAYLPQKFNGMTQP